MIELYFFNVIEVSEIDDYYEKELSNDFINHGAEANLMYEYGVLYLERKPNSIFVLPSSIDLKEYYGSQKKANKR